MRVTTRPAPWRRWRTGRRRPFERSTSRTPARSCMFERTGKWCVAVAAGMAVTTLATGADFAQIERGRYLTIAADCAACHTDPDQNRPFAGGRAIETPFGNVLAPNTTPDRETGIGSWSDAQFDAAVRQGRRLDGKRLYPAMPFVYYAHMARSDVWVSCACLGTIE